MDNLDRSLSDLFSGPICPSCATPFTAEDYDFCEGAACCPNCNTLYKVGKPHVPRAPEDTRDDEGYQPHPEDAQEHHFFDTPDSVALTQFRLDAERLAGAAIRETAGASYELYAIRFSDACQSYIEDLDPDLRPAAIAIALHHGYVEDEDERHAGFGPGLCSVSGIDEAYCHCGRHP